MSKIVRMPLVTDPRSIVGARDTSRPVLLVGFQNQGNLGIGYLAATLRGRGYQVHIRDFETESNAICDAALDLGPVLMGFSLIFQFYIDRYGELLRRLRDRGVSCHFTMGGHFPSLSYAETLALLPELDSVVRFEGELTLLELADRLGTRRDWRDVEGIAYRSPAGVVATSARRLVDDLDELPHPDRDFASLVFLGQPMLPILASRGCARTCSFCSIQTFYRAATGRIVRTRQPAKVVEEMRQLHEERGTTIFLFQDDDFPMFGNVWRRWAYRFAEELQKSGLVGRVIWKMNCRADAVDPELLAVLRDAGLYFVYMGLESGNDEGLRTLHKEISVDENLRAVEVLKRLDLRYEYGFMLFDPSSTFESVRANLRFLRNIVGDGSCTAVFCRMLPYDGTAIKDDLARAGRLRGDVANPDYDFLDPELDRFYRVLTEFVDINGWVHGQDALSWQVSWAWHEVAVLERLFPPLDGMDLYKESLQRITKGANEVLLDVVEELSYAVSDGRAMSCTPEDLEALRRGILDGLVTLRDAFVLRHQATMLRALRSRADGTRVAVVANAG
jgi:anaerobic magnesium-protoporphyrin IX monomethyl ester cyclase